MKNTHCPVPILQDMKEFNVFLNIIENMPISNVMEIGSFYGGTLWYWLQYLSNLKKLVSLDWPIPPSDGRFAEMKSARAQWDGWIEEYRLYNDLEFHSVIGISQQSQTVEGLHKLLKPGELDMLFIDGGHHYEEVRADYQNYKDLVRPETGIIVFHDVCGLEEVRRFWNELKGDHTYMELNNPPGWGIGIIFHK